MKQIRWGFIGCGEVTEKKSGPAFNEVEGSCVVAVMSRNEERVKAYAKRHGIPKWYTDAQELVDDPDVNAVYIATPPSSHATYAIMCMRSGKPCYVEKPLAANYEDCIRVNRISEQTGVPCFVAYYRRYLPYFIKVRKLIATDSIGKVLTVQLQFAVPPRELDYNVSSSLPWRLQPDISRVVISMILLLISSICCKNSLERLFEPMVILRTVEHLYEAEDTISAAFIFDSGISGSASWCFVGHESAKADNITVIGDKGILSFSVYNYDPIQLINNAGSRSIIVPNPPYVQLPIITSVIRHLQGIDTCTATSVSATPVNWVMDRILGKF